MGLNFGGYFRVNGFNWRYILVYLVGCVYGNIVSDVVRRVRKEIFVGRSRGMSN